ncbi:MAG: LEA type 2 family protein [Gammaproteobacteria bacterium]|nr:LEA type 2 family protein [Gammaproteobacteria bacterium]
MRVDNPHHDSFQVNDANVRLHLADAHVANGRLGEPIVVAANDSTEIDVLVEMVPGAAFSWIPLFMGGPDFKVPFEVAGTIYVDEASIGNLPFRQKGIVEKTPQGIQIYPGS